MYGYLTRAIVAGGIAITLALSGFLIYVSVAGASGPSAIPHGQDDYEKCLDCHGAQGIMPGPADHAAFTADTCTACHQYTAATPAREKPDKAPATAACGQCHAGITEQYTNSVHGKALSANNADVPACSQCHATPMQGNAGTEAFHTASVELCISCHANDGLMQKYGISTNVVQSFLDDYHGTTYTLLVKQHENAKIDTAVCTDCHGIHNIKPVDAADSPVSAHNLVYTCAQCHADANANFTATWLSHREPSASNAQLVYSIKWFYRLMIPFMVLGLGAHVALDLRKARDKKHAGGK